MGCERYDVPGYAIDDMNQYAGFEGVETVQAAAALDGENGALTVCVINADLEEDQLLTADLRGFAGWRLEEHLEMHAGSGGLANTWDRPDTLVPRPVGGTALDGGILTAELRPASWNVFRFTDRKA